MSSITSNNFVAISNGNNNNNIVTASNGKSFIATSSSSKGPFTGAKYFKGAAPGTIKKPSARVASMKTAISFDGSKGVDVQVKKCSSPLRNNLFLAPKPSSSCAPAFGSNKAIHQAGRPVPDELASKFVIPSSAHGNGGCPEHLENALAS